MKRILHLYNLAVGRCNLIFVIAIDPVSSMRDLYNFTLFSKAGNIERRLCMPTQLKLAFDPRDAEFDVCVMPKEQSLPPSSHYGIRIWIRRSVSARPRSFSFVDVAPLNPIYRHRLFTDEEFYIARFPLDIYATRPSSPPLPSSPPRPPIVAAGSNGSTPHATAPAGAARPPNRSSMVMPPQPTVLATPHAITDNEHILSAKISGVSVRYIVAVAPVAPQGSEYLISLEYEAGGITRYLVRNIDLRITCQLSALGFTIYTNFLRQTSTGTLHQLSLWVCSPQASPDPSSAPDEDSRVPNGVCQRLWRTESFLVTSPVLALPRSGSIPSLPGALGPEAMIMAQKHTRSPLLIDLPDPPEPKSPFDDPSTTSSINHNEGGSRGSSSSAKEAEAQNGEGVWEWEDPHGGGMALPTYSHSQTGHGHSGAFEDDDGDASIEALVRRMH